MFPMDEWSSEKEKRPTETDLAPRNASYFSSCGHKESPNAVVNMIIVALSISLDDL